MEKEKKKTKIFIIITIILGVLLVGALSYITYDKVFKKDNETKEETKKEETIKEETNTEEDEENYNSNQIDGEVDDEIKELYNFLVADQYHGLYSKNKITKDSNNTQLFGVLLRKYVNENNVGGSTYTYDYENEVEDYGFYYSNVNDESSFFRIDDIKSGKANISEKEGFILKSDFYKWVKKSYNIDLSNVKYNIDDVYYFMNVGDYFVHFYRASSGFATKSYRKIDKVEYVNNNIIIYDRIIVGSVDTVLTYFKSNYDEIAYESNTLVKCILEDDEEEYCNGKKVDSVELKDVFAEYENKLITYKHTFKKDSNGKYVWVSSEPLN